MTMQQEAQRPRNLLRSAGAIFLGLATVFVLSLMTDHVFHALGVHPIFGQPMQDNRLNALALAYRCIYAIVGTTIAARLAARDSMLHAERGRFTFG